MKEVNDLIYALEIKYTNNSGVNTVITIHLHDNGLETKSIRVGNICVTEETINGRILGARLDNSEGYCGYRYDYPYGDNLLNINPNVPINTATSLINKTKMGPDFLSAKLVLSSISRNDYRVVILNKGHISVSKTISATNEKLEKCIIQEIIDLSKLDGEESFVEQSKKRVYQINDKCTVEQNQTVVDSDIKLQLKELSDIISKHPKSYKDLVKLKSKIKLMEECSSVCKINNKGEVL